MGYSAVAAVRRFCGLLGSASLAAFSLAAATRAEQSLDFNRDIRPILSENCFYCHGQDGQKREADLRLDDRQAAIDAGAIVPGEPGASVMLERIRSTDPDVLMPPPDSNRRLSEAQKKILDRWIKDGAEYEPHWAFTPPERPAAPDVKQSDWVRNDIDRFVLAKIEAAGLAPSPAADRSTLIRRLHADLIGLPPTPAEVDAFVPIPIRAHTSYWSIGSSPRPTTASGWRCPGSMPPAMPTATAFSRMATPGSGSGGTGW